MSKDEDRPGGGPHVDAAALDWRALGAPVAEPFTFSIDVDASHMGAAVAHVPNMEYVRWMERTAVAHSKSIGFDRAWYESRGWMWFVRRHEIDYLGEVFEGERVVVATWIDQMEKARSHRRYLMVRLSDGAVVLNALTIWVLIDLKTRRPVRVTDEMREKYTGQSAR